MNDRKTHQVVIYTTGGRTFAGAAETLADARITFEKISRLSNEQTEARISGSRGNPEAEIVTRHITAITVEEI